MTKLISTARFFDPIQISARMTKEATGIDCSNATAGSRNSSTYHFL